MALLFEKKCLRANNFLFFWPNLHIFVWIQHSCVLDPSNSVINSDVCFIYNQCSAEPSVLGLRCLLSPAHPNINP